MIKSELVQKIAEANPHLYQRDVENIVNAILEQIVSALERETGWNCAALVLFLSRSARPAWTQSAHREAGGCGREGRPLFQDRQGDARASQ